MKKISELMRDKDGITFEALNHSTSHLLAAAVLSLYPNTKVAIGPAIEDGFYYDFLFEQPINDKDLVKIEKQMKKMASGNHKITHENISHAKALEVFADQPFKIELINELNGQQISTYTLFKFIDLCKGPHVSETKHLKHFKLLSLAGSYWRGDSTKASLTRIYGTSWFSEDDLNEYITILADRKERDHRKIGKDLEIFMLDDLGGRGLPFWLPNGQTIKNEIQNYLRKKEKAYGFQEISTPIMGNIELYKTSGHWSHYRQNMYPSMKWPYEDETEELVLRPMSCPHFCLVYRHKQRSYRDLPIRYSEQVLQHRYEASGALIGLERVRAMTLTDSHVCLRPSQIGHEIKRLFKLINEIIVDFKIDIDYISLSLRDPKDKEKFYPSDEYWNNAESTITKVLDEMQVKYKVCIGDAAFYGPKIDFQIKTVLGHEITLSTIQLDMLLPSRFQLEYIDENGAKATPVMIHRGLIGTYERFMSILLEQTKGNLPVWLAPIQISIIPIMKDIHSEYANQLLSKFDELDFRAKIDERDERLSYKIRESQLKKIPYTLVIGDNEIQNKNVTFRKFGSEEQTTISLNEFIELIQTKIKNKE